MTAPTELPVDATAPRSPASRAENRGTAQTVFVLLLAAVLVAALGIAVKIWGLVALAMVALAAVPLCFLVLILISVGK